VEELNDFLRSGVSIKARHDKLPAHMDHFSGLLLHALRPYELRSLLRLARPQKRLQTLKPRWFRSGPIGCANGTNLLDIVHEILRGIRVIQQVWADY
jgi:hypothetical protein